MPKNELRGVLNPTELYSIKELVQRGFTRETLANFRSETKLQPVVVGNRHWYYGKELIDWVLNKRESLRGTE
jgi:hypothetical protein